MGRLVIPAGPFFLSGPRARRRVALAGIALLALLCAANSFPGSFIGDDVPIVRDNPLVVGADLRGILESDYWGPGAGSGLYRPLTLLSFVANRVVFGQNPASFHAVNVLLHAAASVLVATTLTTAGVGAGVAWWAAAVFAVHPIHDEAVNIVTGRAELLAAVFVLLAARWSLLRTPASTPLALAAYAAALLSKEHAVVTLALAVLFERHRGTPWRRLASERALLYGGIVAVTLAWLAARRWLLPGGALPANAHYPIDNPLVALEPAGRLVTALKVQLLYLGRLLAPHELNAIFVDTMLGPVRRAVSLEGAAVLLAVGGGLVVGVAGWRRRRPWALGMAIYAAAFAVTANVFFTTSFLMAQRFAYLPSVGFSLAVAGAVSAVAAAVGGRGASLAGRVLLGAFVVALGARTLVRNRDFRSPAALWAAEVTREPQNVRAWVLLAGARLDAGEPAAAEGALRRAIELRPEFTESHLTLGFLLLGEGRPYEAALSFEQVLARVPGESPLAMTGMAQAFLDAGKPREAGEWLAVVPAYFRGRPLYRGLAERVARAADGPPAAAR